MSVVVFKLVMEAALKPGRGRESWESRNLRASKVSGGATWTRRSKLREGLGRKMGGLQRTVTINSSFDSGVFVMMIAIIIVVVIIVDVIVIIMIITNIISLTAVLTVWHFLTH